MIGRASAAVIRATATWLIVGICAAALTLTWIGYSAGLESRRSAELLVQERAEEMADLLVRALARDMRGVQDYVLRDLHRDQLTLAEPADITDVVATAFARYPYPECFFVWDRGRADGVFFTRADRSPRWLPHEPSSQPFPVNVVRDARASSLLVDRVRGAAERGRPFGIFETRIDGDPYQIVAKLVYNLDEPHRLEHIIGFVVNLRWVREAYFRDITSEVHRLSGAREGLQVAVEDEQGVLVGGTPIARGVTPVAARRLRPVFFDPALLAVSSVDLPVEDWTVSVSVVNEQESLAATATVARRLQLTTTAAIALALGLFLTARALRASADLSQLRADFVASVTHELKTPLSTICAVAETLARRPAASGADVRDYAQLLDQEGNRLRRLIDNLLAYSRVTDAGDIYTFEPLPLAELVEDIVRRFQPQFAHHGIDVQVDIPADLPPLAADRTALELVLDNLIDNAVRYAGEGRWLEIGARTAGTQAIVTVRDAGPGIPPNELGRVNKRFVRGKRSEVRGSGLGLAIAGRIVRDHDGHLDIDSEVGRGTCVRLRIPLFRD